MKTIARNLLIFFVFFVASSVYGAAPSVNITVKQKPGGKIVKQVTTDSSGNFSIGTLPAGAYTLEFRSSKPTDVKNKQFSIAVDGTKASGKQSVSGSSLVGGVTLNVEVGPKANVTGQVAAGPNATQKKKMVWITPQLGSNMPGHWVEADSAEAVAARNAGSLGTEDVRKMQDKALSPLGH
jgi:carboxypeptidase family protein